MSLQENMNSVASANRLHIGFFGCRNAGKSSLVNRITGQDMAVVSEVKGTTTDPVTKSMELLPLGPVVIIDTPGFDDEGMLGDLRVKRTRQVINRTDIAVLVVDAETGMRSEDMLLLEMFKKHEIPYLVVWNKADISDAFFAADCQESHEIDAIQIKDVDSGERRSLDSEEINSEKREARTCFIEKDRVKPSEEDIIYVSAKTGAGIEELKERIGALLKDNEDSKSLLDGIIGPGELAVLVIPIDKAAPKGRLIMPQQMAIRSALDKGATVVVTRDSELKETLSGLGRKPDVVITDSQVFSYVSSVVPEEVALTSFSILMAKYKGTLESSVKAVKALDHLKDGDRILMAEGCTHHRQCGDIGTVKIPNWLRKYSGKSISIETCSGKDFPEDLSGFSAVIHCGGCMNTEREMRYRMRCAEDQHVPFTNYGIVIAKMTGILERSIKVFNG
nr:[FeFe] hydrogenase H-cluster maturation GTPase HydF [Oribacterium sp. FC2011]